MAATKYSTEAQLLALCTLLCWEQGIADLEGDGPAMVTLIGTEGGYTETGVHLLEGNPNATDVEFTDVASLPYQDIYFKVLGVPLTVAFDEDGVGLVRFDERL